MKRRSLFRPLLARTEPTPEADDILTPVVADDSALAPLVAGATSADGAASSTAACTSMAGACETIDVAAPGSVAIDIPAPKSEGVAPGSSIASSWSDGQPDEQPPMQETTDPDAAQSDVNAIADDEEPHEEVGTTTDGAGEAVGEGKLLIVVKGARGLAAVDRGGTSDPLAVVTVTGHKTGRKPETKRTKPVMKELNPDWNSPMLFSNVYDPSSEVLLSPCCHMAPAGERVRCFTCASWCAYFARALRCASSSKTMTGCQAARPFLSTSRWLSSASACATSRCPRTAARWSRSLNDPFGLYRSAVTSQFLPNPCLRGHAICTAGVFAWGRRESEGPTAGHSSPVSTAAGFETALPLHLWSQTS